MINGAITYNPFEWLYKWVAGVITLLIGFVISFITSKGPPCTKQNRVFSTNIIAINLTL